MIEISLASAIGNGLFWGAVLAGGAGFILGHGHGNRRLSYWLIPLSFILGIAGHFLIPGRMKLGLPDVMLPWAAAFIASSGVSVALARNSLSNEFLDRPYFVARAVAALTLGGLISGGMYGCTASVLGKASLEAAASKEQEAKNPPARETPELTDGSYIVSAEDIVRERMPDPDSAKFYDEFVVRHPGKIPVVCGYVNAKNRYGGYNGKEAFVSFGVEKGTALQTDMTSSGFSMVWKKLCRP